MKKKPSKPEPPRSAIQIVSSLVRELERLERQCDEVGRELDREESPSLRLQLGKLRQQYSTNLARLIRPALAAEERQGLLLLKTDVDATWTRKMIEFRKALEAIPRRAATHRLFAGLDPVDVELALDKEVAQVLTQLMDSADKR
jgi:hypothetical protein